jgi:hypothetical protein
MTKYYIAAVLLMSGSAAFAAEPGAVSQAVSFCCSAFAACCQAGMACCG